MRSAKVALGTLTLKSERALRGYVLRCQSLMFFGFGGFGLFGGGGCLFALLKQFCIAQFGLTLALNS